MKGGRMQSESENIMSLKKMVWPYKEKKESGLLSVKVAGYEHLVNIYFELGMVIGLSMGNMKNESCLDVLTQCKPLGATFIKGYKAPDFVVARKEEAGKLEELLALYPVTGGKTTGEQSPSIRVSADNIQKLEQDFIDIIGPIGKMLIETFYTENGYTRGQDMPALLYSLLIEKLKEALPSQHQPTFAVKYAIGMALNNDN
jgi:hypothetical protein